jgi:hypothetical protein
MEQVKICPTCKESISKTPLEAILVTFEFDLTGHIYEQGWHRACYQPAAADLVAALRMVRDAISMEDDLVVAFRGEDLEQINKALARVDAAGGEA